MTAVEAEPWPGDEDFYEDEEDIWAGEVDCGGVLTDAADLQIALATAVPVETSDDLTGPDEDVVEEIDLTDEEVEETVDLVRSEYLREGWIQIRDINYVHARNYTRGTLNYKPLKFDITVSSSGAIPVEKWTSTGTIRSEGNTFRWVNPTSYRTTAQTWQDEVWHTWEDDRARLVARPWEVREDERQAWREEQSRRRLERQLAVEKQQAERVVAHERGMELLEMILTDEEKLLRANAKAAGEPDHILVRSQHGNLYRIGFGGVHGNVNLTDEHGCRLANYCAAPQLYNEQGSLPLSDGYVGQYLQLKHDEDAYLAKANVSYRKECQHPGVPVLGLRDAA